MTLLTHVRRVSDARTLESGVVTSGAVGALALVDPALLTPRRRLVYRLAVAAVAAAGVALETAADETYVPEHPWARVVFPVGAAGLMLGFARSSEAWDLRVVRWLHRAGVPRPRLWMAASTFAFSLASQQLGRRLESQEWSAFDEDPVRQPLPSEVRLLVRGMLGATAGHDSEVLQGQLDGAEVNAWPSERGFSSVVDFAVADDARLAVPHRFTFPVKAHFTTVRGHPVQAMLLIEDGQLDALVLDDAAGSTGLDDSGSLAVDQVDRWPAVDDVLFVLDTPTR